MLHMTQNIGHIRGQSEAGFLHSLIKVASYKVYRAEVSKEIGKV